MSKTMYLVLLFQVGKRRCIGEQLGKALTLLTLARLLQEFRLELEPGCDIWAVPVHGFTLSPAKYRVRLSSRSRM